MFFIFARYDLRSNVTFCLVCTENRRDLRLPKTIEYKLTCRLHKFTCYGRRGGLTVSALDSGARGLGSSPGWGQCVVSLSTQVYNWVPAIYCGNLTELRGSDLR